MPPDRKSEPRPLSKGLGEARDRLLRSAALLPAPKRPTDAERDALADSQRSAGVVRGALVHRARVPRRYADLELQKALVPEEALAFLGTWVRGGCVLLAGPPGSGKTAALVYLLREIWLAGEIVYEEDPGRGYIPRWTAPSMLFVKVRRLYEATFEKNRAPLREALRADVLALDDWGAAYEHDWPLAELDGLVDDRWDLGLPTIVTTNLQATREAGGAYSFEALAERAFSRLCAAPGPGLVVLDRRDLRR